MPGLKVLKRYALQATAISIVSDDAVVRFYSLKFGKVKSIYYLVGN